GHEKADMLVILNDNDMSISNNVGALNKYFTRIWSSRTYSALREGSKRVLEKIPAAWEFARRTEEHMKGMVAPGTLFEELGFRSGHEKADMLVILNDNDMSISNNVGALNKYFTRIWSSRTYSALREGSKRVLEKIPAAWEFARRTEEHMKGMVAPGTLFEELGF